MTQAALSFRYRNLMRSALDGRIYQEDPVRFLYLAACRELGTYPDPVALADPSRRLSDLYRFVVDRKTKGEPWWAVAVAAAGLSTSMLGLRSWCDVGLCEDGDDRLELVEELLSDLQDRMVSGNVLDIGAIRPGFAIFCRAHQLSYGHVHQWVDVQVDQSVERIDATVNMMRAVAKDFGISNGISFDALECRPAEASQRYGLVRVGRNFAMDFLDLRDYLLPRVAEGGFVLFEGIYGSENSSALRIASELFPGLKHLCLGIGGWSKRA